MSDRNWYMQGKERPDNFLGRGMINDTPMYREVASDLQNEGSEESILRALTLLEIVGAVDRWVEDNPDQPYGYAPMLLSFEESDIVADAENVWLGNPDNKKRYEQILHEQYQTRLGSAVNHLSGVGYDVSGEASRHDWVFKLGASHPQLSGDQAIGRVYGALKNEHNDPDNLEPALRSGFEYDIQDDGLILVQYSLCPPSSDFEQTINRLAELV